MIIPFAWGLFIFFMHSIPGYDLVYDDPWRLFEFDKLAHMVLFAGFVLTQTVAYRKQVSVRTLNRNPRRWAVSIALVYGAGLEIMQGAMFVSRTSDPLDFLANAMGAFLGLFLFRLIYGPDHYPR